MLEDSLEKQPMLGCYKTGSSVSCLDIVLINVAICAGSRLLVRALLIVWLLRVLFAATWGVPALLLGVPELLIAFRDYLGREGGGPGLLSPTGPREVRLSPRLELYYCLS